MPVSEVLLQNHTEQPSVATPNAVVDTKVQSLNDNTGSGDMARNADIMKAWEAVEPSDSAKLDEQAAAEIDSAKEKIVKKTAKGAEVEPEAEESEAAEEPEQESEEEAEQADSDDSEDRQLTPKESRALIKQRLAMNDRLARKQARLEQQWAQREQQVKQQEARIAEVDAVKAAIDNGDFDGLAKALGVTDWNTLNTIVLQNMQSPLYKQQRKLEQQLREKEQREQALAEQVRQKQAEAERIQAANEWKKDLAAEVEQDSDPAVAQLLKARPALVENLFAIQQHAYHTSGEPISAREAVEQLLPAIYSEHQTWSKFFAEHGESKFLRSLLGLQTPAKSAKVSGQGASILERQTAKKTSGGKSERDVQPVKPRPAAKSISQAQLASASAQRPMTEKELKQHYEKLLSDEWRSAGMRT